MPVYEYQCERCQRMAELFTEKIPGPDTISCTDSTLHCEGRMKKVISQSSFILRGPGWSKDGYGSKK